MAEKLVEITRGSVVECEHYGDFVIVNNEGKLIYSEGNPFKEAYFRSSAKPFQAMNVVLSGAYEKYGFSQKELAIMCASHHGEEYHIDTVKSILGKIGLTKDYIQTGDGTPLSMENAMGLARKGVAFDSLYHNCSGKHSGMLASCLVKNYALDDYLDQDHPLQKDILDIISHFSEITKEKIKIGVDGCSAPIHSMPIYNMALSYAKISNPDNLEEKYQKISNIIFNAMTTYPEMVSGSKGFCSLLMKHSNGKLIGKIGAAGVYCIGVKDKNIGIALKIQDGSMTAIQPVIMKILKEFDILDSKELKKLENFAFPKNINAAQQFVGQVNTTFDIKKWG